jgi:hypothetical protein
MAQVSSAHIWYPAGYPGPAYDLRKIETWVENHKDATNLDVRFTSGGYSVVLTTSKAAFETAKAASIAAGG